MRANPVTRPKLATPMRTAPVRVFRRVIAHHRVSAPGSTGGSMADPKYRRIADSLRLKIESGDLPPDSQLPTETDLSEEFGASRNTVRDAIKSLISLGMVETRPGQGTFVTKPPGSTGHHPVRGRGHWPGRRRGGSVSVGGKQRAPRAHHFRPRRTAPDRLGRDRSSVSAAGGHAAHQPAPAKADRRHALVFADFLLSSAICAEGRGTPPRRVTTSRKERSDTWKRPCSSSKLAIGTGLRCELQI